MLWNLYIFTYEKHIVCSAAVIAAIFYPVLQASIN